MTVLAENTVQVLITDTITLPVPAEKIDEIVARVSEITCYVITDKVIFLGTLHKQIFFVAENGTNRHVGADIPFSGFADTPGVPAGSTCELIPDVVFVGFKLTSTTQLQETAVIHVKIAVNDVSAKTFVISDTLPQLSVRFGEPNTVRVSGPSGGIPETVRVNTGCY